MWNYVYVVIVCDWHHRQCSFFLWLQPLVQYVVGRVVLSRRVTVTGSLAACLPPVPWLVGPSMPQLPMSSLVFRVCRKNKKDISPDRSSCDEWGLRGQTSQVTKTRKIVLDLRLGFWDKHKNDMYVLLFFLTGVYSQVCVLWFPTQNISTQSGKLWNLASLQVGEKDLERKTSPIIWKVHPPPLNVFIQHMLLEYCCSVYWILPY